MLFVTHCIGTTGVERGCRPLDDVFHFRSVIALF